MSTSVDWPNILIGAILGGLVGFGLVHFVDWLWHPRVKEYNFVRDSVNFGTMYKLSFALKGHSQPGLCALSIKWGYDRGQTSVFAKWDETPNPVEGDDLAKFRPELVPSTYYQPLFFKRRYNVPILIKNNNDYYEVFSGWWFGKKHGYGSNPQVRERDSLTLTLVGGNFSWSKTFTVNEIIKETEIT